MSLQLKSMALSGLALLFISLPAFSQTSTIEGTVKDPDGKPLQGAIVNIDRTDIKGHYTVKTDKKGHYGHYGLPLGGKFDVTVMVNGQMRDQVKGVPTKGDPTTLDFNLRSDQAGAAPAPEADRSLSKAQKEEIEKENKAREAQLAKNKELNDAYQAGRAALDAKMYDQAIDAFNKASMIDDKQVAIWSGLADAYIASAGTKPAAEAQPLYDKGFDAFRKAIELKPDDAAYYNNFALALAKDKKIDEARQNLDKAVQLDPPGAGKYHYNMGALLVNSGQNEAAGDEFKKAIAADPNYADAQFQYGVYLASKATTDASGKIVAAPGTVESLQKYLELKPDGPFAGQAKDLIAQLGGSVATKYSNPNSSSNSKKKK